MNHVITTNLSDDFLKNLADFIEENYIKPGQDLRRVAIVFGGARPRLFLQKELSLRLKKPFWPPRFFSIDEFIDYASDKTGPLAALSDFEAVYRLYRLVQKKASLLLKDRKSFAQFLPWAREILSFIEQLDLEDIDIKSLKSIQANAEIGYDVPASINTLLEHIIDVRQAFHQELAQERSSTRGFKYLTVSRSNRLSFDEFDSILFCNFFYLHKTEQKIIDNLYQAKKAVLFFQGDAKDWTVLDHVAKNLQCRIESDKPVQSQYHLSVHSGFDLHSEVCHVREVLKNIKDLNRTVIVLPDPESMIPLLSEIAGLINDFNISMGYPVRRSSLYSLFECLFNSQETRNGDAYYVRDYLRLLSHPLTKNFKKTQDAHVTRILVHKIEEVLLGMEKTSLGGSLFVTLDAIEDENDIYKAALETMRHMDVEADRADLKSLLKEMHEILFRRWEEIDNFYDFSSCLAALLDALLDKSPLEKYPLNLKVMDQMYKIAQEYAGSSFCREKFSKDDIFRIFKDRLENEMVSFSGSPLKGLQILGLFETRSLNFDTVIILDVNESVLPKLKIYEPLIPRDVSLSLGLNRLEKEEEIQRYQFLRLLSGAKDVHLFYQESADKEKSRFIEELIWQKQKAAHQMEALNISGSRFALKVAPQEILVSKRPIHLEFLKDFRFSASSVDTYLHCPLRFYYQYVLGLKEKEALSDEPEARDLGTFIHGVLEETFKKFVGRAPLIDEKFKKYFFSVLDERFEQEFARKMKSDAFLVKEVLDLRLTRFLEHEATRRVKELVSVESVIEDAIRLEGRDFNFKAKIDRIDRLNDNSLLIIDYKTGATDVMPRDIRSIESEGGSRAALKTTVRSFQLPVYYYLVERRQNNDKMNAVLYNIRTLEKDFGANRFFRTEEDGGRRDRILSVFMQALGNIMKEILDPAMPFKADEEDAPYCQSCPFFYLCR